MRSATPILSVLFSLTIALSLPAPAQTFTVIHAFHGEHDGASPLATLTLDAAGNLYGTTFAGGDLSELPCIGIGCGVVFKMTQLSSGWVLTPLYTFMGSDNGTGPASPVMFGPGGLFYTATAFGGNGNCPFGPYPGCGVVLTLQPLATICKAVVCQWRENSIYQFSTQEDGWVPAGNLVFDPAGNLYGVTSYGGTGACFGDGCGTVFELARSGSGWTKTTLYNFNNGGPAIPMSGLVMDRVGNFYGTTNSGGAYNLGTVYELTPSGSGWTETILHSFANGTDGDYANGGLVMDGAGNLYGTSANGGSGAGGTVFELSPLHGSWTFSVIADLPGNGATSGPESSLTLDSAGNLYGATLTGGPYQCGNVFKLTPSGGQWTYTDLHDFTCGNDGGWPMGGVSLDASGNLFGTTEYYGPNNDCNDGCGVVWEITP